VLSSIFHGVQFLIFYILCRWLHDTIANACSLLITGANTNAQWMNTFVFERLMQQMGTWTNRCDGAHAIAGNIDLFAKPLTFIPNAANNNHWVLVAVDHNRKAIAYYDSLDGNGRSYAHAVRDFLAHVSTKLHKAIDVSAYSVMSEEFVQLRRFISFMLTVNVNGSNREVCEVYVGPGVFLSFKHHVS
jgi:hypothetical protein